MSKSSVLSVIYLAQESASTSLSSLPILFFNANIKFNKIDLSQCDLNEVQALNAGYLQLSPCIHVLLLVSSTFLTAVCDC